MLKLSLRSASVIILLMFFASCADMFQDKIPYSGSEPSSLDDLFRTAEKIEKLQSPEQFYIAPYFSSSEIRLTWTAVYGAAYYMVERSVAEPIPESNPLSWADPDENDYEPLERFVYNISYTDQILRNPSLDSTEYNNKYFYRISAYNTAMKYEESEPTVPQSAMLFRAPVNTRATGGSSVEHIEFRWERSEGAESYEVWRSDFPNGASATLLAIVLGNQHWYQNKVSVDEQGKDFYYIVSGKNRFGNTSLQTRPAYGYARVFGAPDKPEEVRLQSNSGRGHSTSEIKIEWDPADEPEAYYAVFRFSSVDSSLTRLTEKTEATKWDDKVGLKPGIYYYYRVQAIVDDIASGKALKSQISDNDPEAFILSAPDTVVAEKNSDNSVTIKWLPPIGNENDRTQYTYKIYSDSSMTGNFTSQIASGISPITDAQGFISERIASVPPGHTFFRVSTVAVKGLIIESEKSMVVSPAPSAAVIVDVSTREFIQNTSANSSGIYPVRITWKKPEGDTPMFYNIQRSTRAGAGYSKINEVSLGAYGPWIPNVYSYDSSTEIYTYMDRNDSARVARKYYYRVMSLNQLEQGNFPSDEKPGWGALTHEQWIAEFNKTYSSAIYKLTLMHKSSDMDKLGTETKYGTISGQIYYNARVAGLGGDITVQQTNYADFYIENDPANGVYFTLNGNSGSEANMSGNGKMKNETITATGMYPGQIYHGNVQLTGGRVSGGTYGVTPDGFPRKELAATVYGYAAGK
ncbi:MAG: hypothetical protein FWB95_06125 [Treponema sp.]|nr:hypothetical protein [Treponema sp.]